MMIMLRRIKTELIITIILNDTQKSFQKKGTWQGQCENFIRTWKIWNITIQTCQILLNSESDALIV